MRKKPKSIKQSQTTKTKITKNITKMELQVIPRQVMVKRGMSKDLENYILGFTEN